MARPKRINLLFCLYHVISRTNSGDIAFTDSRDRDKFLHYLKKYIFLFSYKIHVWCLMPNHFHLLIESTNHAALSELMRRLLTAYTVYYNRRHDRHGHLFQGRFKSFVVDKAGYLLSLSRYIHLNPARWNKPENPETYPGSSFTYYIRGGEPELLYTQEILSWFRGNRRRYAQFVKEGLKKDTRPEIVMQRYIGNREFGLRMTKRLSHKEKTGSRSFRSTQKNEKDLLQKDETRAENLVKAVCKYFDITESLLKNGRQLRGDVGKARKVLILLFLEELPWAHGKIGAYLGLKGKTIISYHLRRICKDKSILTIIREIRG